MLRRLISICRALREDKTQSKGLQPGREGGAGAAGMWSRDGAEIQQFTVETKAGDREGVTVLVDTRQTQHLLSQEHGKHRPCRPGTLQGTATQPRAAATHLVVLSWKDPLQEILTASAWEVQSKTVLPIPCRSSAQAARDTGYCPGSQPSL